MTVSGGRWSLDDQPGEIIPVSPHVWTDLLHDYAGREACPALQRIIEVAQEHGVTFLIREFRYIDMDWRSEHARFYSATYRRYPSVTHRIHFFTGDTPTDLGDLSGIAEHYVGYTILRPVDHAPVGRTMLKPPPALANGTYCGAKELVDVFGWEMKVLAMPFMGQDTQYTRCAHADMWMVLQLAHLSRRMPRRLPSEVHDASLGGVIVGRQIPSDGLSPYQILSGLTTLGLSPGQLTLPTSHSPVLFETLCRYINSNLPPMVISNSHIWTCVGYTRDASRSHSGLTLYRHDDQLGPYLPVEDPWNEPIPGHQPWLTAILPLPQKTYMLAEKAEAVATVLTGAMIRTLDPTNPLIHAERTGNLTYQTYGLPARKFKEGLAKRSNFDPAVARLFRLAMWPRDLWVVELVDRAKRDLGENYVLGEILIDPTARHDPHMNDPCAIASHAPGGAAAQRPDTGKLDTVTCHQGHYSTGLMNPT